MDKSVCFPAFLWQMFPPRVDQVFPLFYKSPPPCSNSQTETFSVKNAPGGPLNACTYCVVTMWQSSPVAGGMFEGCRDDLGLVTLRGISCF